ncbi:MAG: hypothetical protein HGJ97_02080 [Desulfosporosinus sp.]|nr:hypothetical protein [Desulfosporosinus sp.]
MFRRMCVAPCHPWHRNISPSMDKSGATLALRNLSAINATLPKGFALQHHTLWSGVTGV